MTEQRIIVRTGYRDIASDLYYAPVNPVTDKREVVRLGFNAYSNLLKHGEYLEVDETYPGFRLFRKWSVRI
jgi:hypothetical protein